MLFKPSRRRFAAAISVIALGLSAASCTAQQRLPRPIAPLAVPVEQVLSGPALWKVADEDTTIYLFGTVHVLPDDVQWFEGHVSQALASSHELVTEVDTTQTEQLQGQITARAALPAGQTLRELMSDDDKAAYEQAMVSLGLPVGGFDGVRPWFAAMTLSLLPLMKAGYDPEQGVEMVLNNAAGANIARDELETIDFQLDLFAGMEPAKQLEYLRSVVDAVPTVAGTVDAMITQWLEGDADALAQMMNSEMSDREIYDRLLISRNESWAGWIDDRLDRPGTVFIAVGAGHLAGDGSVQDQLTSLGFTVSRVH